VNRTASIRVRRARPAVRAVLAALVVAGAAVSMTGCLSARDGEEGAAPPSAAETPAPEETRADAVTELLEDAHPTACAISFSGGDFSGDDVAFEPELRTEGGLFEELPLPQGGEEVFAGWYPSPESAASHDDGARVGASDTVVCDDRRLTLTAGWMPRADLEALDVGVPILMYHQFTDRPEGVDGPLLLNWAYSVDFDAHMAYLADEGYYLPTWRELSAFIDGELYLPPHSAIVTDDDAHASWFELAVPILNEHRVMATSFVITKWRDELSPSPYVLQRSHTHDMHDPGADGRGRMVNWTAEEIADDLRTSAGVLGAAEVIAYPFGHYDDRSKQGVAQAGYEMAVTIEPGLVHAGADKLALPRMRIDYGMGLEAFVESLG
jgi:hypothetical protein